MTGSWLYAISKRSGFVFEVGNEKIDATIDNFSDLIETGRLGFDRNWHIAQHFNSVQEDDDVFLYTGDQHFGILGYAKVSRVHRVKRTLELKFDREKSLMLLEHPVPAATVRSWKLTLRPNVVDLMPVARQLHRNLPWHIHQEADDLERTSADVAIGDDFTPADLEDARRRIQALIVQRQGQTAFRDRVLQAYGRCCAITNCDVAHVLEAAHIVPYLGPKTNHVGNGLLLRADIHTLFDLHLVAISVKSHRVLISKTLANSEYRALAGTKLRLPQNPAERPSSMALERAWEEFQDAEAKR